MCFFVTNYYTYWVRGNIGFRQLRLIVITPFYVTPLTFKTNVKKVENIQIEKVFINSRTFGVVLNISNIFQFR